MDILALFEKTAFKPLSSIKNTLEGSIDTWPQQIVQSLYEEHPYIGEAQTDMEILRADAENGYLFGMVHVSFSPDGQGDIQIPAIVKEWELQPFLVMISGEDIFPLNEGRFGSLVPQMLEDQPIHGMSEEARMLEDQPIDTNPPTAVQVGDPSIISKVSSDTQTLAALKKLATPLPYVRHRLEKSGALTRVFASRPPSIAERHDSLLLLPKLSRVEVQSTSAQFRKLASKTLPLPKAEAVFGKDTIKEAQQRGYLVLSDTPVKLAEADVSAISYVANRSGIYEVRATSGEPLVGMVLTSVIDFSGKRVPLTIFFNGVSAAVQESITGILLAEAKIPPSENSPKGECVFLYRGPDGTLTSTIPFVVNAIMPGPQGVAWTVETYLNETLNVTQADVLEPVMLAEDAVCVPVSWSLIHIGNPEQRIALAETPEAFDSLAKMAASSEGSIQLFSLGGNDYRLKGAGYDLEVSKPEAHLYLTSLGAPEPERLMKKAHVFGTVTLLGSIPEDQSDTLLQKYQEKRAHVRRYIPQIQEPIVRLIPFVEKWATVLRDTTRPKIAQIEEDTLDNVLSLGFMNEGNTDLFLDSIGVLEDASKKLAGLVLAAELGYDKIPLEEAIAAMTNLETVLSGLNEMHSVQDVE